MQKSKIKLGQTRPKLIICEKQRSNSLAFGLCNFLLLTMSYGTGIWTLDLVYAWMESYEAWFWLVLLIILCFFCYLQKSKGIGAIGIWNTQHCQHLTYAVRVPIVFLYLTLLLYLNSYLKTVVSDHCPFIFIHSWLLELIGLYICMAVAYLFAKLWWLLQFFTAWDAW